MICLQQSAVTCSAQCRAYRMLVGACNCACNLILRPIHVIRYVCSGQSNMDFALPMAFNASAEVVIIESTTTTKNKLHVRT